MKYEIAADLPELKKLIADIHVHIVINSVRKYDTEPQPYMEFDRDLKTGYKHHLSDRYRIYLKQKVMDMCHSNGLNQVDLLTSAERKISEKDKNPVYISE